MNKVKLSLKELVSIKNYSSNNVPKSLDSISFNIDNGKVLGWDIDGRKIAVSSSPVEIVEPDFANFNEVIGLITNVATYYDEVAKRVEFVNKKNETLSKDSEEDKPKVITVDNDFCFDNEFVTRETSSAIEPLIDPVMIERSYVNSPTRIPMMSGIVHYFLPANDAAKESWGKPSSEGLLTKEQLKALKG